MQLRLSFKRLNNLGWLSRAASPESAATHSPTKEKRMKDKAPVVKMLYRLSVEPRVVEHLAKLATRLGEPRSRLATRLFTDAVMATKPPARPPKSTRSAGKAPR